MKIVFMGTPDFAVPSLKTLIEDENKIMAVVTQPDKPRGRGGKISFSPIKEVAVKHNIPVYQPIRIKKDNELISKLIELKPDFIVVVAFGQILSKEILNIPKYGCINLHASLLPKYRGAAPINWAIINGETESGNTTMFMAEGLDTGDMLLKSNFTIDETMNAGELHDILMNDGGQLLLRTLKGLYSDEIIPEKQPEQCEFYAKMLDKTTGTLDFNNESRVILNLIRGLNPWPLANTSYCGKKMKVISAKKGSEEVTNKVAGTILNVSKNGLEVAAKNGSIVITRIQFENSKAMNVSEYIKGNILLEGEVLR